MKIKKIPGSPPGPGKNKMTKQDCLSLHKPDGFENPCLEEKENYDGWCSL